MTDQPQHPPGATLHLGGDAYAHPDLEQATVPIEPTPTSQGLTADPPLTPYPGNPRRGDQDAITASLRDLGLYRPVIVQRSTGHVLAGNHTLRALRDLGAVRVPVTWVDVDDTRAAALVIRDNYTAGLGVDDPTDLLALLTADEEVLALSGRDADGLDDLRRALANAEFVEGALTAGDAAEGVPLEDVSEPIDTEGGGIRVTVVVDPDAKAKLYQLLSGHAWVRDVADAHTRKPS